MAYRDLQEFIDVLEGKGLLKRIKASVDSDLEITEIADRIEMTKDIKDLVDRRWSEYGI